MPSRPAIHCLLGKRIGEDYVVKVGDPITLEQAEVYVAAGWECILDYADLEAFARWEGIQRSMNRPRFFRRRPHQGNGE